MDAAVRYALRSRLVAGGEEAYEQAHATIPEDLVRSFARVGIASWTIWRSGHDLFHVVEADDLAAALSTLATDPADIQWQKTIGVFVEGFVGPDGERDTLPLPQVWDLREQMGSAAAPRDGVPSRPRRVADDDSQDDDFACTQSQGEDLRVTTELAGLVAVVTGGASGIGESITQALRDRGARVAVLDLAPDDLPTGVLGVATDVGDDESVRRAITRVTDELNRIDILVNCAGIGAQGTIESNSDDEWHRVLDINVVGAVRVSRASLPALRGSPSAAIVNIGSIAATAGLPERALYSATKGAVLALTRAMAADHLKDGVRVNCVNPGTVDTPWVDRLLTSAADPEAERRALSARQPHGRLVSADEVAAAVVYLVSPSAGSTTGTSIAVDGGMQDLRLRPGEPT